MFIVNNPFSHVYSDSLYVGNQVENRISTKEEEWFQDEDWEEEEEKDQEEEDETLDDR